ncbi:MAG: hypothetical protein AAGJ87_17305, partial [Pseudomonadota bacterium]
LLSLLHALDVDASAALAHSTNGFQLRDVPPTAAVFDHVVVKMRFGARIYWVDPTFLFQGGGLDAMSEPHYGWVLPLEDYSVALASMEKAPSEEPHLMISETFDFKKGIENGTLRIEMTLRKEFADIARQTVKAYGEDAYMDSVLSAYRQYKLGDLADQSVIDSRDENVVTISVDAPLGKAFKSTQSDGRRTFNYSADTLKSFLPQLSETAPEHSLPVAAPTHIQQNFRALVPDDMAYKRYLTEREFDNDLFRAVITEEAADGVTDYQMSLVVKASSYDKTRHDEIYADHSAAQNILAYHLWRNEEYIENAAMGDNAEQAINLDIPELGDVIESATTDETP